MESQVVQNIPFSCPSCFTESILQNKVTQIPDFLPIVVSSFKCTNERCNYDMSTQNVAHDKIPEKGRIFVLNCKFAKDLDRQLYRSQYCSINIPEIDFQMSESQACLTTVRGLVRKLREDLENNNPFKVQSSGAKPSGTQLYLQKMLDKMRQCEENQLKFTLVLEDPSASTYVQNIYKPNTDPRLHFVDYTRSAQDDELIGTNID